MLHAKPEAALSYAHSRANRIRRHSVSMATPSLSSAAVYLPLRTPQSLGVVLSGVGPTMDYYSAIGTGPGRFRQGSLQPEILTSIY